MALDLQVLVPKRAEFKGKMIEVDIYEAGKHFLKGRPVEESKPFTPSIAKPLQKGEVSGLIKVNTHKYRHIFQISLNACLELSYFSSIKCDSSVNPKYIKINVLKQMHVCKAQSRLYICTPKYELK